MEFRYRTKAYWQARTGWDDDTYDERRSMVMQRVQEKWPNKTFMSLNDPQQKEDMQEWLHPLVVTIDDDFFTEQDPKKKLQAQLDFYTEWGMSLVAQRRERMSIITPSDPIEEDLNVAEESSANVRSAASNQSHGSQDTILRMSEDVKVLPIPYITATDAAFNWDDVEIHVDASPISRIQPRFYIPMIELKPDPINQPCFWHQFSFLKFLRYLESETLIDNLKAQAEFICVDGSANFIFNDAGGYKIMLKRFIKSAMNTPSDPDILRLRIRKRKDSQ